MTKSSILSPEFPVVVKESLEGSGFINICTDMQSLIKTLVYVTNYFNDEGYSLCSVSINAHKVDDSEIYDDFGTYETLSISDDGVVSGLKIKLEDSLRKIIDNCSGADMLVMSMEFGDPSDFFEKNYAYSTKKGDNFEMIPNQPKYIRNYEWKPLRSLDAVGHKANLIVIEGIG
jgi:hypothetical protein